MTATDPALTTLAHSWCALTVLHQRIEGRIERALQAGHRLSVREYSLLEVLSRQHDGEGGHLQMKDLATAVVLSQSATTRLVSRLEDRGLLSRYLCPTDRRGIYTDVTAEGLELLRQARPTNTAALRAALDEAAGDPHTAPLAAAVERLPDIPVRDDRSSPAPVTPSAAEAPVPGARPARRYRRARPTRTGVLSRLAARRRTPSAAR
ncbi:MarR-family transcriptional regulator (plasmid) [Streptantibioticus cattleyicolor NRRL 8057 = DSM 46488]|uniref:MarR-family transcriptional regulator n=1 Tax=Streptantibioticus cattleyicolor (strain ATCC 35852 / DSM 46488 / JCM 4925 / NBRC 14057 / NRRL 8057) TaxID=1003195 RepID=F8JN30_STREN|nr:MarR-family transcriptional regulator [Streptantibioticus cattleyicolor NRRL 8057 = DSM 46488]CCB71738.1 MarR-family transcriptional regulator (modular protein) [Streptantibioticus cattleyicolor NRRL 8057 = DSM 46488]